jgi:peptidylprolyl isomerase/peptidyl-prolyl cis-trans isomerase B (cyclophilin B)
MFAGLAILVILVLAFRYVYSKVSDDDASDAAVSRNNDDSSEETDEEPRVTTTLADDNVAIDPECPAEDGTSDRAVAFTGPPPLCIDPDATYVAQVETTRGDFEITLDPSQAEQNVNSFVFLARYGYYEGVGFHRIIPDFVIQGGDPIGPNVGSGDPGFSVADEPPTEAPYYPLYSVAIANQFPAPDTGNSQFFIVTGPAGEALDPNYSRIGQVTEGEDVVAAIGETGAPDGTGDPLDLTVIERVTISEG